MNGSVPVLSRLYAEHRYFCLESNVQSVQITYLNWARTTQPLLTAENIELLK